MVEHDNASLPKEAERLLFSDVSASPGYHNGILPHRTLPHRTTKRIAKKSIGLDLPHL